MGRYRKIDVRMWGDAWFRNLSPMQPCGQALWIYLLTGPESGMIPGLSRMGEAALAEALGWELKAFRKAFQEAFGEPFPEGSPEARVRADWTARVVWVPNAIRYNPPGNPNVVKSWATAWDEIPECELKAEAYRILKAFTEEMGKPFAEAFVKACRKPFWKALPKASAKALPNQEQEQEHDQEQELTPPYPPLETDGGTQNCETPAEAFSGDGCSGDHGTGQENRTDPPRNAKKQAPSSGDLPPFELPDWIPVQAWADFLEMRRKIKAPMTRRAMELAVKELTRLKERGSEPTAVLERSTLNNWKGLFHVEPERGQQRQPPKRAQFQQQDFEGVNYRAGVKPDGKF